MALTPKQRAELERLGPDLVRAKVLTADHRSAADIAGFATGTAGGPWAGNLLRSDVEGWLSEKHVEETAKRVAEATIQRSTLTWAKVAGIAAIIGVVVSAILGAAGIAVTVWLAK